MSESIFPLEERVVNIFSAPTLIALFPVFASFFFGSHTEHWTDLILLGLLAVYLHNCVTGEDTYLWFAFVLI